MRKDDVEALSDAAITELGQDHLSHSHPDDDGSVVILAFAEPASTATPLGTAVLSQADKFLKMPLREDAGVNTDSHHYIRTFFLEGLKWSSDTWDHWTDKYPQSAVAKPEWCAAFGSYCVRKAYEASGKSLPARLSASASDLATRFEAAGRLLRREKLYGNDGAIRPDAGVVPGPGDLVVFKGHVGILRELYTDGTFTTIEGNTYKGSPRRDGVYQCNRSSTEKRADGTFKVVGFCLLASHDGVGVGAAAAVDTGFGADAKADATKTQSPATAQESSAGSAAAGPQTAQEMPETPEPPSQS